MKATAIRELETDELHGRIGELKEELFNLRFQLATGQLDNHRRMKTVKREIARIRTILRERDFATAVQMLSESAPASPVRTPARTDPTPERAEPAPVPVAAAPATTDDSAETEGS